MVERKQGILMAGLRLTKNIGGSKATEAQSPRRRFKQFSIPSATGVCEKKIPKKIVPGLKRYSD